MNEPITHAEVSRHLQNLERAVVDRVIAEQAMERDFGATTDSHREALATAITQRQAEHLQQLEALSGQHAEHRRGIEARFGAEQAAAGEERRAARKAVERKASAEVGEVTRKHEDARWVAQSVLDETSEDSPKRQFERVRGQLEKSREQQYVALTALQTDVAAAMAERSWSRGPPPPPEPISKKTDELAEAFAGCVDEARAALDDMRKLRVPKLFIGMRPLWMFILLLIATGVPAFLFAEPSMVGVSVARTDGAWVGMVSGAALIASLLILTILYTLSSMQLADVLSHMHEQTAAAEFHHQQWGLAADRERLRQQKECDALQQKMEQQLAEQLRRFDAVHQQTLDDVEERRVSQLNDIERDFNDRTQQIARRRDAELSEADAYHRQQVDSRTRQYESDHARLQQEFDGYVRGRRTAYQRARDGMISAWFGRLEAIDGAAATARETCRKRYPGWSALTGDAWVPPKTIPPGLQVGYVNVELANIEGGISTDAALIPRTTEMTFPFVLPFPNGASLLMKTVGTESRRAALQAMQVYLLRMLTLLPPGKLRLTIFDPIGLGESFSGLMHLADYDELLITSRIWTETSQFEARLADLTEHMENVLQKYLRNEFSSIEAYNEFAGEVAEPYHVLVVADFPNKFSEQAARRLTSVATSGPRCGVYLLMSANASQPVPHGFDLDDVEAAATTLTWHTPSTADGSLSSSFPKSVWERTPQSSAFREADAADEPIHLDDDSESRVFGEGRSQSEGNERGVTRLGDHSAFYLESHDPALDRWPIVFDEPPPPETFTQIVKTVGEASKNVRRVEVSFSRIAPPPDDVWSKDSRGGIDIPLGRAGATKLQLLRLGKGTSQHMLVAGKTGSGKSTFFHALITNAAMHYSPEELEFYLVDFKKGVEFKAYAGGKLPHARVIAIESDREFGISVLQRLDGILHERGELFREMGVQDIAGYRTAMRDTRHGMRDTGYAGRDTRGGIRGTTTGNNSHPASRIAHPDRMPRIMLVIDEFQEFFVEDDRYSQQAALLLDRLVRQGRAFGIHVVLGSQTLGGAYSLARSTLGQVAVRIALQCSEADAHLILSESNTAARLLTRPGEAIYNDSNGTVEGNHPFQIAWLPDEERAAYLAVLQHFAEQHGIEREPPIVFEGNVPSDPADNRELVRLIESPSTTADHASRAIPSIWLGDAVEIGPPTYVTFPEHAGSNLLIVGQDPHAAAGVVASGYLALAAQILRSDDAVAAATASRLWIFDGSHVGSPEAEFWKQLAGVAPELTRIVTPGNVRQSLVDLTAELARRDVSNAPADSNSRGAGGVRPPLFVLVNNLSRFRDLRKGDDDFGFAGFRSSEAAKPADPSRQFADLIAKGAEQGIHVLAWVDSAGNLDRWLSRQSLKEFELRVAFAMNAGDSSNLIDSPAASKLGPHRALLYREETGTTTKFRPYGPPTPEWLSRVRLHLTASQPLESAMDLDEFQVS